MTLDESNSASWSSEPITDETNWGASRGQSEPGLLNLHLQIDDPVVLEALRAAPEGLERDRFAIQALRIGVMAIKSAAGQIDTDSIRNEGNRLIEELTKMVSGYQARTAESLDDVLREYFNPENGRFTENVGRLVSEDGDLQRLLQNHLSRAQTGIQTTIDQLVGQDSPLMRLLSPGEANTFFEHFSAVARTAIEDQNQRILQQFSLDVPESALNRLLSELRSNHIHVGSNLQEHITNVMQEFSLDHEDSALNRMLRQIQAASMQIRGEFTLDNDQSALARIRQELRQLIVEQNNAALSFQERITNEISALNARRQEAQRGVQHGNEFEASVISTLEVLFLESDDQIEAVGNTTGEIPRSKVGDAVITLGADCVAPGARIVVEAKEDASYTISRALEEMAVARENRKAQYGIFVVSAKLQLAQSVGLLRRFENDILIVWSSEDRSTDVALKAAVMLAKGLIVRAARERAEFEADLDAMDRAIANVVRQVEGFEAINTSANTIKSGAEKILERTRQIRERIQNDLDILSREMNGLRNG